MDIQEAIKLIEYSKRLLGQSDKGDGWTPNAVTIACDMAISALHEQAEREKGCCWKEVDDDCDMSCRYDTDCGHTFSFEIGTPQENGFTICPYCGRRLK